MKINKRGFSLLEIMVTMSIMLLVMPLLISLITDIQKNSSSNIASSVQRARDSEGISRIGRIINSSSKIIARDFGEAAPGASIASVNSISTFYLKTIALPTTFISGSKRTYTPLALTSRILPVYDPDGTFSPENIDSSQFTHTFTNANVGNSFMCITVEDFLTYPYNSTTGKYLANSSSKRRFPLYQIHYFFLASTTGSIFDKRVSPAIGVNKELISLFEWKSQYFLDYNELNNFVTCSGTNICGLGGCGFTGSCTISTTQSTILDDFKLKVTQFITTPNANTVKPDLMKEIPIAGVLKQSETQYLAGSPATNPPIAFPLSDISISNFSDGSGIKALTGVEYTAKSIPMLSIENLLRYPSSSDMAYGIAANNYVSDTTYKASHANRVPFFKGTVSNTSDGFPHGFEVMLSGTAGSTKAFIRLMTLASGYGTYSYNSSMTTFQGKN